MFTIRFNKSRNFDAKLCKRTIIKDNRLEPLCKWPILKQMLKPMLLIIYYRFYLFLFFFIQKSGFLMTERSGEIALPNVWLAWNGTDIETALTVKSTLGVTLSANVPGGIKIPYFTQKDMYLYYQRSCHSKFWGTCLVAKEVCLPACDKRIWNWKNWCYFGDFDSRLDKRGLLFPG